MYCKGLPRLLRHGLVAIAATVCVSTTAMASYSEVVFFGDSLSDTGNLYAATGGAIPASPPYYNGQFSNGPVWSQDFASRLGLSATPSFLGGTNYALAGATMLPYSGATGQVTSQLPAYFSTTGGVADANALYVVLGGGNDIKFASLDPATAIASVMGAAQAVGDMVQALYDAGARNILVGNLPDVGLTPLAINSGTAAGASFLTQVFNATLASALANSEAADIGLDLDMFDLYGLMNAVVANPAAYGFDNVTEACKSGPRGADGAVCATPDTYLFWDEFHPSAKAHLLIADAALRAVPEPGVLLLAITGLAMALWSKTRMPVGRRRTA